MSQKEAPRVGLLKALEHVLKPISLLIRDDSTGELEHREVVGREALPAHEQFPKAVVPTVGSFDDAASWRPPHAAQEGWLASSSHWEVFPSEWDTWGAGITPNPERGPSDDRLVYQPWVQMEGAGPLGGPRVCRGPWPQAGGGAVRPGPQDRSAVARPGAGSGRSGSHPNAEAASSSLAGTRGFRMFNHAQPLRGPILDDEEQDVRDDPPTAHDGFHVGKVVALVQAEMLRASWSPRGSEHDRVEHVGHHPL